MKQTYIKQLKDHIGESVTLKGWLYNKRSSGKLVFLQLRDGTGNVQCVVFKPNASRETSIRKLPSSSRQRAFQMIFRASAHALE